MPGGPIEDRGELEKNQQDKEATPLLRVTIRCLTKDLSLPISLAELSTDEIEHDLVRKFVAARSQNPRGVEKVQPLENASEVYTLHAGRWRGATWHDKAHGVVWLLSAGYHRSGERADAYPHFKQLDAEDRLAPTERDYDLLFRLQERTFADSILEEVPQIMELSRRSAPREIRRVLGGTVPISVAVQRDEGLEVVYLAISMRLEEGGLRPPPEWMAILFAAFFPWIGDPIEDLSQEEQIAGRPKARDELIFAAIREVQ